MFGSILKKQVIYSLDPKKNVVRHKLSGLISYASKLTLKIIYSVYEMIAMNLYLNAALRLTVLILSEIV